MKELMKKVNVLASGYYERELDNGCELNDLCFLKIYDESLIESFSDYIFKRPQIDNVKFKGSDDDCILSLDIDNHDVYNYTARLGALKIAQETLNIHFKSEKISLINYGDIDENEND